MQKLLTFNGIFLYLFILPHIINYTITITKRYENVESNGKEA